MRSGLLATVTVVAALAIAGAQRASAALVLHYAFEDNLNDSSPSNNTGIFSNNINSTPGGTPTYVASAFPYLGKAIDFAALENVISTNNIPISGNAPRTYSLWFRSDAPGDQSLGGWGTVQSQRMFEFYAPTNAAGPHVWFGHVTPVSYASNEWVMITTTYSGGLFRIFKNGVLVGSTNDIDNNSIPNQIIDTAVSKLIVGKGGPGHTRTFAGLMDDVRIFDNVLADHQILALYQTGGVPEPAGALLLTAVGAVGWGFSRRRRGSAASDAR